MSFTCMEVGGLIFRLELIYVVQVFTRCSCDVSSIPGGVGVESIMKCSNGRMEEKWC